MVLCFNEQVFPPLISLSVGSVALRDNLCYEEVLSFRKTLFDHLFECRCKNRVIVVQLQLVVHDAFVADQFDFSLILREWLVEVLTGLRGENTLDLIGV